MKFYDIDDLETKCGTDNKYRITALVAARARWLSEQKSIDMLQVKEKYLSAALLEVEQGSIPARWLEELESGVQPSSIGSVPTEAAPIEAAQDVTPQ
ncbi:MAG: DNA-directed RNA polymerase subunit omega [Synergistaceae bacterium]|jgi:DNA-directed RNA polymerase subunit K/omega|nr:DNA-directed RNA polymerase subunit omega [Synergistaceae bacterium]